MLEVLLVVLFIGEGVIFIGGLFLEKYFINMLNKVNEKRDGINVVFLILRGILKYWEFIFGFCKL